MTSGNVRIDDLEGSIEALSALLNFANGVHESSDFKKVQTLHVALIQGQRNIEAGQTWVDFVYVDGYEINKRGIIRTKEDRPQGLFSYRNASKPEWDYVHWELMDVDGKPHQFKVFTPKGLEPIVVPVAPGYIPFRNRIVEDPVVTPLMERPCGCGHAYGDHGEDTVCWQFEMVNGGAKWCPCTSFRDAK